MKAFDRVLTTFGILLLLAVRADAHDSSMPHHEWFNKQEMNPTVQRRLGLPYKSCCNNGDVFRTRTANSTIAFTGSRIAIGCAGQPQG